VPTTLYCKECGCIWLEHTTIPDTHGRQGDKYYMGKKNYYVAAYERLGGHCPGCGREMVDPDVFKHYLGVRVVDALLSEVQKEALRMRTGGRNAGNFRRRKK